MNDWGGAVNVCGAINVSGAVIIQGGGQYALGNQRLWGNQCLYDSKDPLKPPLRFFFRSAKVAITRSCWFLSATEYHSEADYNLRRLGVVVVVVVVIVVSILKNG